MILLGFQLKSAYTLPPDWKADIPYTLDSVARYSYQNPTQQEELKLPVDRYGSNKKKHLAVDGTSKWRLYSLIDVFLNKVIGLSLCFMNSLTRVVSAQIFFYFDS